MGSRNFSLGSRDMKVAGHFALKKMMMSFQSVATMVDRWARFIDYVDREHGIRRMEHISRDVVLGYGEFIADLVEEGLLASATAQNYLSTVNRVMSFARHDPAVWVSPVGDCGIPRRSGIAVVNLAVPELLHREWCDVVDPRLRILLEVQRQFGLRFEESAKLDACTALKDARSGWITIREGTKGGRGRQLPIQTDVQCETLVRAAAIQRGDRSMIPESVTYREFRRNSYRIAVTHGIRYHRERHAYTHRRYQELVGEPCPVASGIKHGQVHWTWLSAQLNITEEIAMTIDMSARKIIARELGHNRPEVSHAYLG